MKNKIIVMLASIMLITGCHSSESQSQSTVPDEPDYSQDSLIISGGMIDFPVTDQASARSSIANAGSLLGITDISTELGDCTEFDTHGIHTYRFTRQHDGIPVFGSSVVVCAGSNGEVLQISGRSIDFDGISTEPKTGIEEIISNLRSANGIDEDAAIFGDGLVFYISEQNQPVLCYRLISADTVWYECLVSAETGEILFQTMPETERAICSGKDTQGNYKEFTAEYENSAYYLIDYEKNIFVYNAKGHIFNYVWGLEDSEGHIYTDLETNSQGKAVKGLDENGNAVYFKTADNDSCSVYDGNGNKVGDNASLALLFNLRGKWAGSIEIGTSEEKEWKDNKAVTLYTGLQGIYDFCKSVLNINSYNDNNGSIYGIYDDWCQLDGGIDPTNAYSSNPTNDIAILSIGSWNDATIDVIGHEFGHSINAHFIRFDTNGEPAAINEGIADVYGELIEDWYDDNLMNGSNDWILDKRNLAEPEKSKYPAEYQGKNWQNTRISNDKGGRHKNCTVISHAAYLMSIGGKQKNCTPLNNTDIAMVYYHTLQDNDLPTNVGMIEFSEKMINTARMLASQSILDWDKVTTVIRSLAEVNLSDSGNSYSLLKPDFKIEVLDPNGTLYDDYHVEIISCDNRLFAFSPAFFLTEGSDAYSLFDEFDVTTHEMPSVHLPDGFYILRLTDNQTKTIIHKFSVEVSETGGIADKLQARTALLSFDQPVSENAEYSPVETKKIPVGLQEFLATFALAVDRTFAYLPENSSREYEYDAMNGHETWILPFVLDMTDFSRYSVTIKSDEKTAWIEEADLDWILTNIYNFSAEALDDLKHDPAYSDIYHDGKYELRFGAGAPGVVITNINAAFNGKYYYVSYNISLIYPGSPDPEIQDQKHYALLEYKIIDGKGYWTLYKDTIDSNAIKAPGIN